MKVFEKRLVDIVVDRICDVCNESVMKKVADEQYEECAEFKANFGYGSKLDGNSYHLDLCEDCFMTALYALKDKRRSVVMFNDVQDMPSESFGLDLTRTQK
jgi:hypothetical protein